MSELLPKEVFRLCDRYLSVFVENIMGLKNPDFLNELDAVLDNKAYKKIVIAYPRGHGKSTHLSVAYPLRKIAQNHNLRILLVSDTANIARSFLAQIVSHVENNELYKAFSMQIDPKQKGVVPKIRLTKKQEEKWSGESITIDREDLNLKDPTINAVGLFGSILSKRADVIICDDVANQENSATEDQRKKIKDWVRTTVMPVLVPGGVFVYLGNTWNMDDIVETFLKDPLFDYRKRIPAIQNESKHPELWEQYGQILLDESIPVEGRKKKADDFYEANRQEMDDGIKVLWQERFPYSELYKLRLSDGYSFARMYQCDPSNRPDQRFRDEWIEMCTKRGADLILQETPRDGVEVEVTASGLDLAISLESGSDDTCLLTLDKVKRAVENSTLKAGDYVIRQIWRGKFSPNAVKDKIKTHHETVNPDGIRVETVAYQDSIRQDLNDMGIPVRGYHTGKEKFDPAIGVNSLAILAEQKKLVIPFNQSDAHTRTECARLINEMRAFPDGHTGDALMALWFARSEVESITGSQYVFPSLIPLIKESPDVHNPEVRKEEEKKVDLAQQLESEYERSQYAAMMGKYWRMK